MRAHFSRPRTLIFAALLLASCASDSNGPKQPVYDLSGCTDIVVPKDGQEYIQERLIAALPGDTVCLGAGTFEFDEELSISQKGLTLRGLGQETSILSFAKQTVGANGIQITGDNITLERFTVKNTPGDGIRAQAVKDVVFREISVLWDAKASLDNGAYGLYPVQSEGVTIEKCIVSGARDAGVYVGQSKRVLVKDTEAYGNVAGFELENTIEAEAYNNHAHDNTAGFLIFNLPGIPIQNGGVGRSLVHDNVFEHNNQPNFAEPGTTVATVPPGCGMVMLATDQNEITKNDIKDNGTTGIFIASYNEPLIGTANDPMYDLYPESNFIHSNTFTNNGKEPAPAINAIVIADPIPDILWDGCSDAMKDNSTGALTNCLKDNGAATFVSLGACEGFKETSDIASVTCEKPPVKPEAP